MPVLFLTGGPGTGKTTVASVLHGRRGWPWFEFGWIPEFRRLNPHTEISYEEEELISLENLTFAAKNYLRHGFECVILTDIRERFTDRILEDFADVGVTAVILAAASDGTVRERVLGRDNGNGYRDADEAVRINREFLARPEREGVKRILTDDASPEEIADRIEAILGAAEKL